MTTTASVFQFSPDGRSVAWANSDGTVHIADLDALSVPFKSSNKGSRGSLIR